MDNSPQLTSETPLDSDTAHNNSISENGENVNPKNKKNARYALSIDGESVTVEGEQTKNLVAIFSPASVVVIKKHGVKPCVK